MRRIGALFVAAATVCLASAAGAATVAIDYRLVNKGTLEDFEIYPLGTALPAGPPSPGAGLPAGPVGGLPAGPIGPGLQPGPALAPDRAVFLRGFTLRMDWPHIPEISLEPPCGGAGGRCLVANFDPASALPVGFDAPPRVVLNGFAPDTRSVGLRLLGELDLFQVRVAGGSGRLDYIVYPGALAWDDPLGITSVEVVGRVALDDVRTSELAPIPLPPAWGALVLGLGMLGWLRRRRVEGDA